MKPHSRYCDSNISLRSKLSRDEICRMPYPYEDIIQYCVDRSTDKQAVKRSREESLRLYESLSALEGSVARCSDCKYPKISSGKLCGLPVRDDCFEDHSTACPGSNYWNRDDPEKVCHPLQLQPYKLLPPRAVRLGCQSVQARGKTLIYRIPRDVRGHYSQVNPGKQMNILRSADVLVAKLTAASSLLPRCPTAKILVTSKEYCSKKVTISDLEDLPSSFASACQVVASPPTNAAASVS